MGEEMSLWGRWFRFMQRADARMERISKHGKTAAQIRNAVAKRRRKTELGRATKARQRPSYQGGRHKMTSHRNRRNARCSRSWRRA